VLALLFVMIYEESLLSVIVTLLKVSISFSLLTLLSALATVTGQFSIIRNAINTLGKTSRVEHLSLTLKQILLKKHAHRAVKFAFQICHSHCSHNKCRFFEVFQGPESGRMRSARAFSIAENVAISSTSNKSFSFQNFLHTTTKSPH